MSKERPRPEKSSVDWDSLTLDSPATAASEGKGDPGRTPLSVTPDLSGWLPRIASQSVAPWPSGATTQFLRYVALLREWNEKMNLTAITDDEGIAVRHILDSLTLLPDILATRQAPGRRAGQAVRLIDIGSGAGFPGLPLKIVCPDLDVVLLDSLAKRVRFLETVIAELQLTGIRAIHGRAEDAARRADLRERFDLATARAVAPLPVLCEYCLPFVRPGGQFLAMKGQAADELAGAAQAIQILGGQTATATTFQLPGTDMNRMIIRISKIRPTPAVYPRKAGKAEQNPL